MFDTLEELIAKVAHRNFVSFRVDSWIVFTAWVEEPIHEFTQNDRWYLTCESLRDNPRYKDLRKRMNLPE
jgi:hypothetical protein